MFSVLEFQLLSKYMSDLLAIQDNLLKASAEEFLRTALLHMISKEQNIQKEYLPILCDSELKHKNSVNILCACFVLWLSYVADQF